MYVRVWDDIMPCYLLDACQCVCDSRMRVLNAFNKIKTYDTMSESGPTGWAILGA